MNSVTLLLILMLAVIVGFGCVGSPPRPAGSQRTVTFQLSGVWLMVGLLVMAILYWGWFSPPRRGEGRPHLTLPLSVNGEGTSPLPSPLAERARVR
jgi:hypothetical protein